MVDHPVGWPNNLGVEVALQFAHHVPAAAGLHRESMLEWTPYSKFKEKNYETLFELLINLYPESQFGNFLEPEMGMIHSSSSVELLPRLAEGEFKVRIPRYDMTLFGERAVVPANNVTVEHLRSYHPNTIFSPQLLCELKDAGLLEQGVRKEMLQKTQALVQYAGQGQEGMIEKIVNLQFLSRERTNVFSTLTVRRDAPAEWEETNQAFEAAYDARIKPYLQERQEKIQSMLKDDRLETVIANISREDKKFIAPLAPLIRKKAIQHIIQQQEHSQALARIRMEYGTLTSALPFVPVRYIAGRYVAFDGAGRILGYNNVAPDAPMTRADHDMSSVEVIKFPFNDAFQGTLRERLAQEPKRMKEYEVEAIRLLHDAYQLFEDRHDAAAITRAATALEVELRGFHIDRGMDPDRARGHSIREMMDRSFDDATSADTGGRRYVFPKNLRKRLGRFQNGTAAPSILEIRNAEVHRGRSGEEQSDAYVATVALATFAEAINYVQHEGWKRKGSIDSGSTALTWLYSHIQGRVPEVTEKESVDMLQRGLRRGMDWLDPRELKMMRKYSGPTAWSHTTLTK